MSEIPEMSVLAALTQDRASYDSLREVIDEEDFTDQARIVLREVRTFYEADSRATACDLDIIGARIRRDLRNPKHAELFDVLLGKIRKTISPANVAREYLEVKRERCAEQLASLLAGGQRGQQLNSALAEFERLNTAADLGLDNETGLYDRGVRDLFGVDLADDQKLRLLPSPLNDRIRGGVRPGHVVVVFGRVNVGKSLFVLNMAAGFIRQGKTVLFIENEDSAEDTQSRMVKRLTKLTEEQIKTDLDAAERAAKDAGIGRFLLQEMYPGSLAEIGRAVVAHQPDVVVVNQARNLEVAGKEGAVTNLDKIAQGLRSLAKRHKVVMVLVTAAAEGDRDSQGNAREKAVLEMPDCYSSRTGIPAAADVMIGYGSTFSMRSNNKAAVSICKNKLGPIEDHFYVEVDPERGLLRPEAA